jgi:hypothetical protein
VDRKPEKSLGVLWATYEDELAPIASKLPANAREYALAPWHCDPTDHRCIHDSWVEAINVVESGAGERKQKRTLGLVIRLLGAYHDRYLFLKFSGVQSYAIEHSSNTNHGKRGHGDVLDDSIQLTPQGYVLYSLRMEFGRVEIEAKDLEFSEALIS